jgi:hypothetical protein
MKPLPTAAIVVTALALAVNGALAAPLHARTGARAAHVTPTHAAVHPARKRVARARPQVDPARLVQYLLGGGWPAFYGQVVHLARTAPSHGTYVPSYSSPTYDTTPAVDPSSAARDAQAAADAVNQAIQQMNDVNALNASMAAAEQQNDAANAATLQTELNANF